MKQCKKCKITKFLDAFHSHENMKDGYINTCKECASRRKKERFENNRDIPKSNHLKYRYNLKLEDYKKMIAEQNNCCAICSISRDKISRDFSVDHDHETGKIRGLLCFNCNMVLGYSRESLGDLKKAQMYLLRHQIDYMEM